MSTSSEEHWEQVYRSRPSTEVSWFQAEPATSLRLIVSAAEGDSSVLDVGAGSSLLVDALVAGSFTDVTVLDVSEVALDRVRRRLGQSPAVTLVHADLLEWVAERTYDVWHDRAVFHFLRHPYERARYVELVEEAISPGGAVVVATFALDAPTHCSGLEVCRYDVQGLAAEFGSGFDLLHTEREEHVTPGGAIQPFTWAVLRRRWPRAR
ncbi:MAG TPA: class I SAM-dependent methyltransferase [Dermatophilaceae bacterium]